MCICTVHTVGMEGDVYIRMSLSPPTISVVCPASCAESEGSRKLHRDCG